MVPLANQPGLLTHPHKACGLNSVRVEGTEVCLLRLLGSVTCNAAFSDKCLPNARVESTQPSGWLSYDNTLLDSGLAFGFFQSVPSQNLVDAPCNELSVL